MSTTLTSSVEGALAWKSPLASQCVFAMRAYVFSCLATCAQDRQTRAPRPQLTRNSKAHGSSFKAKHREALQAATC